MFNETTETSATGATGLNSSYSPFQLLFLLRLARMLYERQEWAGKVENNDWRLKLLNKSIYSTFCDCVEQGVGEEARSLFEQKRVARVA